MTSETTTLTDHGGIGDCICDKCTHPKKGKAAMTRRNLVKFGFGHGEMNLVMKKCISTDFMRRSFHGASHWY